MDVNESFNHVWDFIQVLWFLLHCSLLPCMSIMYVYLVLYVANNYFDILVFIFFIGIVWKEAFEVS